MSTANRDESASGINPDQGSAARADHDRELPEVDLLSPLTIRGVTFRNRIVVSPMCQYCAEEGLASDWHLVHLGSRGRGGAAAVFVEATAVTRDGRITPGDMGIWGDQHVEPLARIARFVSSQGAAPGDSAGARRPQGELRRAVERRATNQVGGRRGLAGRWAKHVAVLRSRSAIDRAR